MKKILVTGGTSGIGLSVVRRLLQDGCVVWVIGRNPDKLTSLQEQWGELCKFIPFDLNSFNQYANFVDGLPVFDGVVFSAGIVGNNPLKFFSVEKYRTLISVNQDSPIVMTGELVRKNKISMSGSIVFLSSITGAVVGMKGIASYAASKAALLGAAKVIALELAHKNIRVNCVAPGMVNTELVKNATYLSDDAKKSDMARYPLGNRYAEPAEVAGVISFLIGKDSSFITGQTIVVDGGFTLN
jgi:NAD(P)-dependent dehydrogenase (short-subunit alcohol dehydrogenase family)